MRKLKNAPMPEKAAMPHPRPTDPEQVKSLAEKLKAPERLPKAGDDVVYLPDPEDALYAETREAHGAIPSDSSRECGLVATIAFVGADGRINLMVIAINGSVHARTDVPRKQWKFLKLD
jgi:hypothetical protein